MQSHPHASSDLAIQAAFLVYLIDVLTELSTETACFMSRYFCVILTSGSGNGRSSLTRRVLLFGHFQEPSFPSNSVGPSLLVPGSLWAYIIDGREAMAIEQHPVISCPQVSIVKSRAVGALLTVGHTLQSEHRLMKDVVPWTCFKNEPLIVAALSPAGSAETYPLAAFEVGQASTSISADLTL